MAEADGINLSAGGLSYTVILDMRHLMEWSPAGERLYWQTVKYPQEMIPLMDLVLIHEYMRIRHRE